MKKIIVRLLIGLFILGAAAVLVAGLFMGSIIKKGIETFGPQIAGVDIKVENVYIGLLSGTGAVKGLVVGNPEGYKAHEAISIGKIGISVSPGSLFSDKVIIRSIRIESPEIAFEGTSRKNNLAKILNNVKASIDVKKKNIEKDKQAQGKKIQVDDLLITGAKIHIGKGTLTLNNLPDIHMTAMGSGADGITTSELAKRVLEELESAILKAVAGSALDLGKDAVGAAGKGAINGITNIFKKKKK